MQDQLSRREPRELARSRETDRPVRPITSFHADSRYVGDYHRADMAWAVHAAANGLSREQIEHQILNSCDLSKEVRRWVGSRTQRGPHTMRG